VALTPDGLNYPPQGEAYKQLKQAQTLRHTNFISTIKNNNHSHAIFLSPRLTSHIVSGLRRGYYSLDALEEILKIGK
jgi:hypothetical protein